MKIKRFDKERCSGFAAEKGIAMYDTASQVRRLKDNASDKFLEVVTPTDLRGMLSLIPECRAIVTTGQKASEVVADTFGCSMPAVGTYTDFNIDDKIMRFWRMPSSSRAYPLPLEKKAEYYSKMFKTENIKITNV